MIVVLVCALGSYELHSLYYKVSSDLHSSCDYSAIVVVNTFILVFLLIQV